MSAAIVNFSETKAGKLSTTSETTCSLALELD